MSSPQIYLTRTKVRERYGISNMTLWRWERDPRLNFPKAIEINGRLYQSQTALEEWERRRISVSSSRGAQ
jgi:predicted DNA-binding transcriptional regulator AlpA